MPEKQKRIKIIEFIPGCDWAFRNDEFVLTESGNHYIAVDTPDFGRFFTRHFVETNSEYFKEV